MKKLSVPLACLLCGSLSTLSSEQLGVAFPILPNNWQVDDQIETSKQVEKTEKNQEKCRDLLGGFYAEALYFKAIEDSLKYAERIPQNATFRPKTSSVEQNFCYDPGVRLGLIFPIFPSKWQLETSWMYFHANPSERHAKDDDYGILASLLIPTWGATGNAFVNKVSGRWKMTMNTVDMKLERMFMPIKRFYVTPSGGLMAGFIQQSVNVHYQDIRIDFPEDNTPHKVHGHSNMWSLGPVLGVEFGCSFPSHFSLFFNGSIAALVGQFSLKTKYRDFIDAPSSSRIEIRDHERRGFLVEQFQAGISKKWLYCKWGCELTLGWEFQDWGRQMRLNWFNSFSVPPTGADLTLYGPFLKFMVDF